MEIKKEFLLKLIKRGCPGSRLLPEQPSQFHVVSLKRHETAAFITVILYLVKP